MKYVCDSCGLEFKSESDCLEHERCHCYNIRVGDYITVNLLGCRVCKVKEILDPISSTLPLRLMCEEVVGHDKEKLILKTTDVKRATVWDFIKTLNPKEAANFFAILISKHPEFVKDHIKDALNESLTDKKFEEVLRMTNFILSCFC